jgi:hypothetical protein
MKTAQGTRRRGHEEESMENDAGGRGHGAGHKAHSKGRTVNGAGATAEYACHTVRCVQVEST